MLSRKSSNRKATQVSVSCLGNLECLEQPDKWGTPEQGRLGGRGGSRLVCPAEIDLACAEGSGKPLKASEQGTDVGTGATHEFPWPACSQTGQTAGSSNQGGAADL